MNNARMTFAPLLAVCVVGLCSGGVTVQSPNGGERVPAQGQWLITWSCDGSTEQAMIEFSYTDGVFWEMVAPAVSCAGGSGSYPWTVPALSSPACLIRITGLNEAGGSDQSNAAFTVFPCTLQMDYDHDCAITFTDFAAFAQEWLACGDPYDLGCTGNRAPRIISIPPLEVTGSNYTYQVTAYDPDGDPLTYALLRAPAGMIIYPDTGSLTWQPAGQQQGRAPVIIQVRDALGAADIQAFELNGPDVPPQAQISSTGAPVDGYPNLYERRVLVYTNAVRMAPQQYRDRYMADFQPSAAGILQGQNQVEPLYYTPRLNESARSHASDMAANGCFQHNSCDGTVWSERIRSFYPGASWIGENIAIGYPTAKAVIDAWLCDETGGACAADGTGAAGHRTNMVDSTFRRLGAGYAPDAASTWRRYWVQDFAAATLADKPPLVAGCHDFLQTGQTSFLLNYRDTANQPPASVQVVVDEVTYDMGLDLGTASAGTYRLDLPRAGTCREYYFLAVTAAGETWRYPGPGVFLTAGESACGQDYR